MPMQEKDKDHMRVQEFVRLLTKHQVRIRAYILALVPSFSDAEDIMQETSRMLWEKFPEYELGTNFQAWGLKIAFYRVLDYRKQKKRERVVFLDEAVIHQIEKQVRTRPERSCDYLHYLRDCIRRLTDRDAHLVRLRYEQGMQVKDMADTVKKSVQAVYQHLGRIHDLLSGCVRRAAWTDERS